MDNQILEKIKSHLTNVSQIPTLPDVYFRVKKAFEDPSLSVEYLADAIRYDQSLTIALLRLSNSSLFGFRNKISSINQAVMMIGLREVYSLVLSVSVMGLFPVEEIEGDYFPARKFWEHSLAVGIASRSFATSMGMSNPDEFFVAGLIHDIGKMIEKTYITEPFKQVCSLAKEKGIFLLEAEKEILGFTHADVGEYLTMEWLFPDFLRQMTACHHDLNRASSEVFKNGVAIVQAADSLVRAISIGWPGDPYITPIGMDVLKRLHLIPFNEMSVLISKIRQEYDGARKALMGV